jgi:hypothetical protein
VTSTVERGGFRPWWTNVAVSVFGTAALPKEVRVGGNVVHDWRYDAQSHALTVVVPESSAGWTVRVSF